MVPRSSLPTVALMHPTQVAQPFRREGWVFVRGSQGLDVGDHVRVELVDADVERGFIDFRASD